LEGRINSCFRNKFGDYINEGFIRLFYFRENIKQFQIIQESLDKIIVNLVLKDKKQLKVIEKDFMEITAGIEKIMGNETIIKYNLVDVIHPGPSGKYMYVFSKVKNWEKSSTIGNSININKKETY